MDWIWTIPFFKKNTSNSSALIFSSSSWIELNLVSHRVWLKTDPKSEALCFPRRREVFPFSFERHQLHWIELLKKERERQGGRGGRGGRGGGCGGGGGLSGPSPASAAEMIRFLFSTTHNGSWEWLISIRFHRERNGALFRSISFCCCSCCCRWWCCRCCWLVESIRFRYYLNWFVWFASALVVYRFFFSSFYLVYWILPSFIEFPRLLLGFTGFQKGVLGFPERHSDWMFFFANGIGRHLFCFHSFIHWDFFLKKEHRETRPREIRRKFEGDKEKKRFLKTKMNENYFEKKRKKRIWKRKKPIACRPTISFFFSFSLGGRRFCFGCPSVSFVPSFYRVSSLFSRSRSGHRGWHVRHVFGRELFHSESFNRFHLLLSRSGDLCMFLPSFTEFYRVSSSLSFTKTRFPKIGNSHWVRAQLWILA